MKKLIVLIALISTPSYAKEITLTLNDQEQAAFMNLLDAAVKGSGMLAAGSAVYFQNKVGMAQQIANQPPKVEQPKAEEAKPETPK